MKIHNIEPTDPSTKEKAKYVKNLHGKVIGLATSCFGFVSMTGASLVVAKMNAPVEVISIPFVMGLISGGIGMKIAGNLRNAVDKKYFSAEYAQKILNIVETEYGGPSEIIEIAGTVKKLHKNINQVMTTAFAAGGLLAGAALSAVNSSGKLSGFSSISMVFVLLSGMGLASAISYRKDFAKEINGPEVIETKERTKK